MSDINPACAVMTADCPPENQCRLQVEACHAEITKGDAPNKSCYRYRCLTCSRAWHVEWPQIQPVYDRDGRNLTPPKPTIIPA